MSDIGLRGRKGVHPNLPSSLPDGYHYILIKLIAEVSSDPEKLRRLVYALAWHSLKPEFAESRTVSSEADQPSTIVELIQAREFERAVALAEAFVTQSALSIEAPDRSHQNGWLSVEDQHREQKGVIFDRTSNSVVTTSAETDLNRLPEASPAWLRKTAGLVNSFPTHTIEYGPIANRIQNRLGLRLYLQLVTVAMIGVTLFASMTLLSRTGSWPAAPTVYPEAKTQSSNLAGATAVSQSVPSFPLPKTYGVFASSDGHLLELEQLPIKIPDARVLISAEITKSSRTMVYGKDLSFVVFRRELVNSAPQIATVRVVARVARTTKFIDGKAVVVPIEGSWRIRSASYELKISPIQNEREMIVIKPVPDLEFLPGRYALVLNGIGYEFTVAGQVTAAEQCLEQVQAMNGLLLFECSRS